MMPASFRLPVPITFRHKKKWEPEKELKYA
jgi:hypothetical protein